MRASQFLHTLLIELAILPKRVHLFINLFGIERSQLLTQLFQAYGRPDAGYQIEYLYLCRSEGYCFHHFIIYV